MRAPAANKCRADVDTLFHEFGVVRVTMSAEHVYIQLFRPSFLVTGSIHKPNRNFYTRAHMNIYIYIYIMSLYVHVHIVGKVCMVNNTHTHTNT